MTATQYAYTEYVLVLNAAEWWVDVVHARNPMYGTRDMRVRQIQKANLYNVVMSCEVATSKRRVEN